MIGGFIAKPVIGRLWVRRANLYSLPLSVSVSLVTALLTGHWWIFGTLYFLGNITLGIQSTTFFLLMADSVDVQERLFGDRNEGLLTSALSFSTKVGMAFGAALTAYGLAIAGYNPHAVTESAREQVSVLYFLGPAFFAVLQIIVIGFLRGSEGEPRLAEKKAVGLAL